MGMSGIDAAHLAVAVALTYLLGFERDLRGAPTGDRVFALVGAGAGGRGTSPTTTSQSRSTSRRRRRKIRNAARSV